MHVYAIKHDLLSVRINLKICRLSHSPPVAEISSSKFRLCYLLRVVSFRR
ncbi:hypothetical protein Hdeb2414_s0071g00773401 [Helianthus debilis subsp. tardiflorus]